MGEWKTSELSPDLCTIVAGSTPTTSDARYWGGENVWITPNDLSSWDGHIISDSDRKLTDLGVKRATGKLLPAYSVVISCRAPVGYCAIVSVPFSTNQGCKTLICQGINETYLYYVLTQSTAALERVSSGTTFLELPKKELARFKISFPVSDNEQSKIAEILSTVDEAIDKTRALIEKFKNIKTGMMQDLLTNGIDKNGVIRSLKTHEYKDSPLGLIPVEWDCRRFDEVMPLQRGHDLPQYSIVQGEYPVACSNGIIAMHSQYTAKGPCVWTGRSGTIGHVFFSEQNCWMHNTSLWVTDFCGNDEKFIYYLLSSFDIKKYLAGTGVPTLNRNDLHFQHVILPINIEEQQRIAEMLTAADAKIHAEHDYLKKLQNLKLGLMQDLLTNTVSVDVLL